jgi:hypothetical protein
VALGRPVVGDVTVTYPDRPTLPTRRVDLPFQDTAETSAVVFSIDAAVSRPSLASTLLHIAPDECVTSVAVNGAEVRAIDGQVAEEWCWPQEFTLDVGDALRPGKNTLRLVVTNAEGPHGVDIAPVLAPLHVLVAALFAGGTLAAVLWPVVTHPGKRRRLLRRVASAAARVVPVECFDERRFWAYARFPLAIAAAEAVVLGSMHYAHPIQWALAAAQLAGRTLPLLLFVRVLDRADRTPLRLRVSSLALALCAACTTLAVLAGAPVSHPWHIGGSDGGLREAALLAALGTAVAATVPVRELMRRARGRPGLTLLLAASLLPYAEPWLSRPAWHAFHGVLTGAVLLLVRAQGVPADAVWYDDPKWGGADVVRTENWELEVISDYGDFRTAMYFVALFAAVLLSRPSRAARPARVVALLTVGVAGLVLMNGWRMASLVVFASDLIRASGRSPTVYQHIAMFHAEGAPRLLACYVAYFGLSLWACARWLDRDRATRHRVLTGRWPRG